MWIDDPAPVNYNQDFHKKLHEIKYYFFSLGAPAATIATTNPCTSTTSSTSRRVCVPSLTTFPQMIFPLYFSRICPICLDNIQPNEEVLGCTVCRKEFHYGELITWLTTSTQQNQVLRCPACRGDMGKRTNAILHDSTYQILFNRLGVSSTNSCCSSSTSSAKSR